MLRWWLPVVVVGAGHIAIAGGLLADRWLKRRWAGIGLLLIVTFIGYLAVPAVMTMVLGSPIPAYLLLALVSCLGVPAYARIGLQGRPLWPELREGFRNALTESRRAWIVNAVLFLAVILPTAFVLPHFERTWRDWGGALPTLTQAVVDDSYLLSREWLLVLPFLAAMHLYAWYWEALVRAGARGTAALRAYRWVVWAGLLLYGIAVAVGIELMTLNLEGHIR